MKIQIAACLLLITLFSCNRNEKKEFLDQTIKENQLRKNNTLVSYTIDKETTQDSVTTMYYHAQVINASTAITIADSLTYAVVGDGVYTSQ